MFRLLRYFSITNVVAIVSVTVVPGSLCPGGVRYDNHCVNGLKESTF